jgi:diguanylate cyclase (GGDEF)-like protein/PAS domain S-box-containing protein
MLAGYRHDAILEAVAKSAKELLRSHDLGQSWLKVLERIGRATEVDRVHIFEIDPMTPRELGRIREHHLWTVPGIPTPALFGNAKGSATTEVGLGSWVPRLMRGEPIFGHVQGFERPVRRFLEFGGVKSVVVVPVFAEGEWWGLIGFDSCRNEREWSPAEIDTLETLAEMVGAAVTRARNLKSLADASQIIENSPTVLFRLAPQAPFPLIFLSQNIRRYGYDADELLAAPNRWPQLIEREDLAALVANIKSVAAGEVEQAHTEFRLRKPDGSDVWFDGQGSALRDGEGRLVAVEGILNDVTARKRAEDRLSFSHILLTTAVENSPDAILVVDANARIIMSNRHFAELWDIPAEFMHAGFDEPVLRTVASRMKDKKEFVARVRYLYDHPEIQSHEELELEDGRIIDRHSGSLYDAQQKYLGRVWFFRDITAKKRAAEKIAALARTDALTGLANRAAFLDRLNLEFARAKRGGNEFAVLYLDLDHFKDVNDTLGHPVGDELLQAVAERLKSCVRETDMVARFGGDEFAVLQDDTVDVGNAQLLATKIGAVLADPFMIGGNQVHTTASIGIVPYRADIEGADAMMTKADLALYRAKDEGRNGFRFHVAELDRQVQERVAIREDLHGALERHEFELFYQPQVELLSGRIAGLEALIRWRHPTRGLLLPAAFIPVAETTGCIVQIGNWVIEEVCRQIKAWRDRGTALPLVALNLSAAQFKLAPDLDRVVAENLASYGIAPDHLELELTESVLLETTERYAEALERVRRLGVRLAIDDFGTGYSSLDYLRLFRVSRLKIDRRFVEHVTTNPDDAIIVRATISLARALGIEVVAEGVETAEQQKLLLSAGCTFAQGRYFWRPMPAADVTALLARNFGSQTGPA